MKNLLIIGASNSTTSINKSFARHAGSLINGTDHTTLDLNEYEMPIYSSERESHSGIPDAAQRFVELIESADGVILSLAEHNGSYSAAFKNVLDWSSRQKQKLWSERPMLLLSTSPGERGGSTVLAAAEGSLPYLGANVIDTFSLPSFYDNYSEGVGITDEDLKAQFESVVSRFSQAL